LLGDLGLGAQTAVPDLVEIVKNPEAERSLRVEASSALRRVGKESIPMLIAFLEDRDPVVRQLAVYQLKNCDWEQEGVVEALLEAFMDEDKNVRLQAAAFLQENEAKRTRAVWRKVEAGLQDPRPRVRVYSAHAILGVSPKHKAAVAVAVQGLKEDDPLVRKAAAQALAKMKEKIGKGTVKALAEALGDSDPEVREEVALALYEIDSNAAPAVAALVGALDDSHTPVREWATAALSHLGVLATPAVSKVIALLEDIIEKGLHPAEVVPDFHLSFLLRVLTEIGPPARPAEDVVRRVAVHFADNEQIREQAELALEQFTED
jgi:HEAT repeat protein